MSQRRIAKDFHLNRKTVVRKFLFLELICEFRFKTGNLQKERAKIIEFDDLETFEHTKCKPISVTIAVEYKTRRILSFEVSSMPAKGMLVEKAKKYGPRFEGRRTARRKLLAGLKDLVTEDVLLKSDSNPHYPPDVAELFPNSRHVTYLGKRGSLGGQGELKKVVFDPLFSLNHTCAMFRANVNRLFRRTWCTTKNIDRLRAHLMIYACYHNENLKA
jgi:hypothetical protein